MNNQRITNDWLILVTLALRFPASCRFWVSSCTIGWLNLVDLALRFLAFLHLLNVFTCHPSTPPDWFDLTIPCILAIPPCFNSRSFAFAQLHWVVKASIYCLQLTIPCVLAIQLCSGTTLPSPLLHIGRSRKGLFANIQLHSSQGRQTKGRPTRPILSEQAHRCDLTSYEGLMSN